MTILLNVKKNESKAIRKNDVCKSLTQIVCRVFAISTEVVLPPNELNANDVTDAKKIQQTQSRCTRNRFYGKS